LENGNVEEDGSIILRGGVDWTSSGSHPLPVSCISDGQFSDYNIRDYFIRSALE